MGGSQSTLNRFRFFQANRRRDQAIDATLTVVQTSLRAFDSAVDLLPVSGIGTAVSILQTMIQQIQNTRMNDKIAAELRVEIFDLVHSIGIIVEKLNERLKPNIDALDDEQKAHISAAQSAKPSLFKEIVDRLVADLKPLPDDIKTAQVGGWLSRLLRNSFITSQLDEVKGKIAAAKERFQFHQTTVVAKTVEELETLTEDLRAMQAETLSAVEGLQAMQVASLSKMDDDKYDEDLRALPRVNAAYNAIGDSGYVEGTRISVLDELHVWSEGIGEDALQRFFLLIGEGGTGKSTIAREMCRKLQAEGRLGASFFFVRSDTGTLGSMQSIYPTIAFQLAALQPRLRQHIAEAARGFMNLPSGSLKEQMESLILTPLKKVQDECSYQAAKPMVIVIDALDEANGELATFLGSLKELVDRESRIRVLIATRPESPIMRTLKSTGIESMGKQKLMGDIPQDEVDSDIRRFLKLRFQKFWYQEKLLTEHPDAIEKLTQKAGRLFIYARTVALYLDCKSWEVAVQRLTTILDGGVAKSGMHALSALYTNVLKNAFDDEAMEIVAVRVRVVGVLAGLVILQDQVTINTLAVLMGVEEDAAIRTVEELRSIVTYTGDIKKDIIRPLHLTLREFLVDKERCLKEFRVDRRTHHLEIARTCLRIMNDELRPDICELKDAFKGEIKDLESRVEQQIPPHVQYACLYWATHIVENEPTINSDIHSYLEQFCRTKVLQWIEVLSLMNRLDLVIHSLLRVYPWAKVFTGIATLLEDAYRFAGRFYELINESPEQIYTSALTFAPECALVNLYANEERSCIMVSPREPQWGACLNIVNARGESSYSRDGQFLLSWSFYELVIRDGITINPQKTVLIGGWVVSVDIHPNNRSVALLLGNGTVVEWEWASELQMTRMYALPEADAAKPRPFLGKLAYGCDGSRIVCHWKSIDAILVWSTVDQTQPANRILIPAGMECATFSLDAEEVYMATLLTSKSERAIVKCWHIERGEEMSSLQIEMDEVQQAAFANNNKMLVTGHGTRWSVARGDKICVWSLGSDCGTLTTTINEHWNAFDVTRSGDVIATGYLDIYFWNARTGEILGKYKGHSSAINSLRFSPQEDRLLSTSGDGTLSIWDRRQEALALSSHDVRFLSNVTFSPNGKCIAAIVERTNEFINIFSGDDGSFRTELEWCAHSLTFSADGSLLATTEGADGVWLYDVESKATLPWMLTESMGLEGDLAIAFNAAATLLVVVQTLDDYSFTIRIWDVKYPPNDTENDIGMKIFQSDSIHGHTPHCIRFNPVEPLSLVRYLEQDDNEVIIWDHTSKGVEICAFDENIHSSLKPAFAIEESWVVSTRTHRRLLWLSGDRRPKHAPHYAVSGEMIAIASNAGKFTVLDMSRLYHSRREKLVHTER